MGQIYGFAYILNSIKKVYPKLELNHLYFTRELKTDNFSLDRLELNSICLGGPKCNWVTKIFLSELVLPVIFDNDFNLTNVLKQKRYEPEIKNGELLTDYGIIVKAMNPRGVKGGKVFIIAGCHTFGTIGAAKYFCDKLPYSSISNFPEFEVVVKVSVIGSYVNKIKVIEWHKVESEQ